MKLTKNVKRYFDSAQEAKNHFRNYQPFDTDSSKHVFFTDDNKELNFGDWVLLQEIRRGKEISRPILGLFTGYTVWDMALVVNFVEAPRAYQNHYYVQTNKEIGICLCLAEMDPYVENFPLWNDDLIILGFWNGEPSKAQLREALTKKL